MKDATDFSVIMRQIEDFVQQKGWMVPDSAKPQTPRNLAASICIEASELLECFQWSDLAAHQDMESELADVLIYSLRFAQVAGIDPLNAIAKKLEVNRQRTWS
jgi:NTP pyrophosphatase (non-canonical NTP hydrolase)